jgi:hypothetical protein
VNAIADFIHIAGTIGVAADNTSLDRGTGDPAGADRLLGRSIKDNI